MRLFIVLCMLLGSLAGPQLRLLHSAGHSFLVPVTRPSQRPFTLHSSSTLIFDPEFVKSELRRLLNKYRPAQDLLAEHLTVPVSAVAISQVSSSTSSTSGTVHVPLTNVIQNGLDILYYADIKIGTPLQALTVDIDTGSADLFVPSKCAADQCGNHKQFNPKASTTFVDQGKTVKLAFGSGQVEGNLGQDVVSMQGLAVYNQSFIAVSSESSDFKDEPSDGLIGMAFSTIAVSNKPTFFENLIQTRSVPKPEFSLHLARGLVTGSELCLGCFNSARALGPSTYFPVVSKSYWTLKMDGLSVNGTELAADGVTAAIDSGTTLIYVPGALAENFYASIPGSRQLSDLGSGFYAYPCNASFIPSIVFDGKGFGINMKDFDLGRLSEDSLECMGGIMGLPSGFPSGLAIVGDEFLKSWYTTFDYLGPRVGFAPSANNRM